MAERVDPVVGASTKSPVFDTKPAGDDGLRRADGISGLCMFFLDIEWWLSAISNLFRFQTKEMSLRPPPRTVVRLEFLVLPS